MDPIPKYREGGFHLSVLLVLSIFLLLFCSQLVEKSMFIDGVWYAGIARNMMLGQGAFWQPQFSATIFAQFYEHPPLVFGLQSFFFQLFGDHFLTERGFSLLQYFLSALLIVGLWRGAHRQSGSAVQLLWFLPLLLWQSNIVNYFYLPANVLDSTLSLFALAAILLLLRATMVKQPIAYLLAAAVMIVLAVLSKGLTGLFPLVFLGIYTLIFRQWTWTKTIAYSLSLLGMVAVCLTALLLFSPVAADSLLNYMDVQVMASLNGERRTYHFRSNRLFILGQLGMALLPMAAMVIASRLYLWFRPNNQDHSKLHRYALCFFLVGLSASLPLIISPRQALLYLLPSIPYFSLAFACWAAPGVAAFWADLLRYPLRRQLMQFALFALCGVGLFFTSHNYGRVTDRDQIVVSDAQKIAAIIGNDVVVASTVYNMYISGYLMRDFRISLDTSRTAGAPFIISTAEQTISNNEYQKLPLATQQYILYQKKSNHQISLDNGEYQQ